MYYPRVSMYSSSAAAAAVRSSAPPPDGFVASAMKMARSALHKISGCDSEELIKACKSGNSHLVDKALEKHALQDNSALLAAVMRGHTNIVKLLAHKITVINANLIEALAEAAASGNNDMIILLLHDQVTAREYGLPALRQALANEHIDTIDLLINAGADPTSLGKECIEVAGKYKRVDVLQVLKEKDPAFGEHLGEALDSLLDINPLGPEEEDAISCLLGFQSG
jgi:ankyrin repeat protein